MGGSKSEVTRLGIPCHAHSSSQMAAPQLLDSACPCPGRLWQCRQDGGAVPTGHSLTKQRTWEPPQSAPCRGGPREVAGQSRVSSLAAPALVQPSAASRGGLGASFNLLAIRTRVQVRVKEQPGKPPVSPWLTLRLTGHWPCRMSNSACSRPRPGYPRPGDTTPGGLEEQSKLLPGFWICH